MLALRVECLQKCLEGLRMLALELQRLQEGPDGL
jgi:hypothetical protein